MPQCFAGNTNGNARYDRRDDHAGYRRLKAGATVRSPGSTPQVHLRCERGGLRMSQLRLRGRNGEALSQRFVAGA
jgi:hypothetical protein